MANVSKKHGVSSETLLKHLNTNKLPTSDQIWFIFVCVLYD